MSEIIYEAIKDSDGVDCYIKRGEVVRCKDCIMTSGRDEYIDRWWCIVHRGFMNDNYYCADGERRKDDDNE